jgi:biopolymer transport protein ExbD
MAGGGSNDHSDGLISDINVTPLVDIMLCLMVIFMIASAIVLAAPKAIEVELPKAASGEQPKAASTFAVTIKDENDAPVYYFNEGRVSRGEISALVVAAKRANSEVQAIIAADKSLEYGEVMWLIDRIRVDGVIKYALNIEHDPAANPVAPQGR